jgi:hypothetical protein
VRHAHVLKVVNALLKPNVINARNSVGIRNVRKYTAGVTLHIAIGGRAVGFRDQWLGEDLAGVGFAWGTFAMKRLEA